MSATKAQANVISTGHKFTVKGPLWKYLVVLCLLVITFPGDFQAIRPGLDASWKFALNYLTQTDFVFGRDFVHPYGPLGYVIHPLDIGSNLIEATIFRLVIHAIFAGCLLVYALKARSGLNLLLFAIGYSLSMVAVITLEFTYHLLLVVSLLFCVSLMDKRLWWIAAPLCAALAASLLFMKFGIGIAAFAILAMATIVWVCLNPEGWWKVVLVALGSYLSTFVLLATIYLQTPRTTLLWAERSLNMSDGYTVAQSLLGQRRFLALALLALAAYAWVLISLYRQKSSLRYIASAFAPVMFLAFKHGFVQGHGHERNFFPFLLASISLLALNMTTRTERKTVVIGYCLVLVLAAPVGIFYSPRPGIPPAYQTLLGWTGLGNISSTIGFTETRKRLEVESARNLRSRPLPDAWKEEIGAGKGTVDVIPWELSYVLAGGAQWSPDTTIQLFNAYTPSLDRWNAEHFLGGSAPDYLIVEFLTIDGRHLLLDTPAVTRNLLRNYTLDKEEPDRNLMLLKKRPKPIEEDLAVLGRGNLHPDEWIDVPRTDRLLFGSFDMSLSPYGVITKLLLRIPPVRVDVVYESGRESSYRITPELARDGFLLNYVPEGQPEFFAFMKGCIGDKVVRFRVTGPGTQFYRQSMDLRWEQGFLPSRLSQQRTCTS